MSYHVTDVQFKLTICKSLIFLICFTENLAFNKQAWQSSTLISDTGADRAVDGQYTDLRGWAGSCAVSNGGHITAEWRVDLGGVKNIHHVFIQYATENRVWGNVSFNRFNLFNLTECIIYTIITELKWRVVINIHYVFILYVTGNYVCGNVYL